MGFPAGTSSTQSGLDHRAWLASLVEGADDVKRRAFRAAFNLDTRRLLRSYEPGPPPALPPFPATLRSAFLACPANRASTESAAGAELCPVPPDITLYAQGRPIEAHRVILAARSPYFRAKLTTEWRNRKAVTLVSSHPLFFQVMHGLVDFFYCDRVEVPADDIEAWAPICKDYMCEGILELVNRSIDRKIRYRSDAHTRQLDREYPPPPRRFLLQGRSLDRPRRDRLPSDLRRILQECLANSREEDVRNNEPVETCGSPKCYDDLADVCIKVEDRVFRCHQLFLALRSEYFKTRLSRRSDFLERHCSGGELPLLEEHDMRADAFEKMLEYVYTDKLEHLSDDPLIQAEELFDLGSRYLMSGFKRVVADLLLPHLGLDRLSSAELCRWLVLSDVYDVVKLREHCLDIIASNFEAFAEAREFRALLRTLVTPAVSQRDLLNDLRKTWLAAALDRTDESVALFDQRLELLVLAAEQEANDDDSNG